MKCRPEDHPRTNPQLHYVLCLCQHDLTVSSALHWLTALNELHQAHQDLREHLKEREFHALGGFAIIIDFINKLDSAIPFQLLLTPKDAFSHPDCRHLNAICTRQKY
jgi:hypothetical protein